MHKQQVDINRYIHSYPLNSYPHLSQLKNPTKILMSTNCRYAKNMFILCLTDYYKNKILLHTVTYTHAYTIDYMGCQCILIFKVPKTLLTFRQDKSRGGWHFMGDLGFVLFFRLPGKIISCLIQHQTSRIYQTRFYSSTIAKDTYI